MHNRLRLLMGATALLYLGPLLAGLGGFGWQTVPVFAVIFVLWLFILRPHEWPRDLADWQRPEAWLALAARAAVQLLLVVVCFGIGRGIGGVLGALPPFSILLPIAISFLSIPLARLIWDPWKAEGMNRFLDHALEQLEGLGPTLAPEGAGASVIDPLFALPQDAAPDTVMAALDHLLGVRATSGQRFDAIVETLDTTRHDAVRTGLIHWLTTPEVARARQGQGLMRQAFPVMAYDRPEFAALFVSRARALIEAAPHLWADFPRYQDLGYLVDHHNDPDLDSDISALARAVEAATPADRRGDDLPEAAIA